MSTAPINATLQGDVERFAAAMRLLGEAILEAARPAVATIAELGRRYARYLLNPTPQEVAQRHLDHGLDAAEREYQLQLVMARDDLLRGASWYAQRERTWAALTWGITEQDALDRAADVMRRSFQLGLTQLQAARVAVAILEGYSSRPAAWR